jgi:8-oxo-dGTP diphosphatase
MDLNQNIKVAVDAIVFGYANQKLNVLLIKQKFGIFKNQWALVGGFVKDEESLQNAVQRELKEETGITVRYLEQLYDLFWFWLVQVRIYNLHLILKRV